MDEVLDMTGTKQARIEAALNAYTERDLVQNRVEKPHEYRPLSDWSPQSIGRMEAALAAADAVVTVEMIMETIDRADKSTRTGSKPHRQRIVAAAIHRLYRGEEQS